MLYNGSQINKKRKRYIEVNDDDEDNNFNTDIFKGLNPFKKIFGGQDDIKKEDNNIYFYENVSKDSILDLSLNIKQLTKKILKKSIDYNTKPNPIYLHINSYGGCLHSARAIVDVILLNPVPIYTIIEGYAASAATIMAIVGAKRFMKPNSEVLIHQLSSGVWGKMEEIKDEFQNLEKEMKWIVDIYSKHSKGKLQGKKLTDLLKHDLSLDANECLKFGLVDEIGDPSNDYFFGKITE